MKKNLYKAAYKYISICLITVVCCNQQPDKDKSNAALIQGTLPKDTLKASVPYEEKLNPKPQEKLDSSFENFYLKFHTDSQYQISKIKFPLPGFNTYEEGDDLSDGQSSSKYFWAKNKWVLMKIPDLDNTYSIKKVKTDSTYDETISIPNSGYYIIRNFKKENGEWYLVFYGVHNL